MRPVPQTTFGGADAVPEERGDCLSACLATLLDLALTEVPRFCELDNSEDWLPAINRWTNERGFFYVECCLDGEPYREYIPFSGLHILSGLAQRRHQHSVVVNGWQWVHDPHPSGVFLTPHTEENPWSRGFLVPLDPMQCRDWEGL